MFWPAQRHGAAAATAGAAHALLGGPTHQSQTRTAPAPGCEMPPGSTVKSRSVVMGRPWLETVALKDAGEAVAATAGDQAGEGGGPGT